MPPLKEQIEADKLSNSELNGLLSALHGSFKRRAEAIYDSYSDTSIKLGVDDDMPKALLLRTNIMDDFAAVIEGLLPSR